MLAVQTFRVQHQISWEDSRSLHTLTIQGPKQEWMEVEHASVSNLQSLEQDQLTGHQVSEPKHHHQGQAPDEVAVAHVSDPDQHQQRPGTRSANKKQVIHPKTSSSDSRTR
jgi:hypothetical protein